MREERGYPIWTRDLKCDDVSPERCALQRDYIVCSQAYMEMAIGNAPWPIGVTNAGIHARPARESIFSKQIAHVLNDETQRKYIQVRSQFKPTPAENALLFHFAC